MMSLLLLNTFLDLAISCVHLESIRLPSAQFLRKVSHSRLLELLLTIKYHPCTSATAKDSLRYYGCKRTQKLCHIVLNDPVEIVLSPTYTIAAVVVINAKHVYICHS